MFSPDEIAQTTEALESMTEALEKVSRPLDRRVSASERRQNLLQHKHTDILPTVSPESPGVRLAWRQVIQLREENRHLRTELDYQQKELQQLQVEYDALKAELQEEIAVIHSGHGQEIAQYQSHLQEIMEERNRIHTQYLELEQHYHELADAFAEQLESRTRQFVEDATNAVLSDSEQTTYLLHDVVKTVELQVRQEEDKYLAETLYFKRELQKIADQLEQERQQIAEERQQLFAWQYNLRQQATLRYQVLHDRLRLRWRFASILTSLGLLALLVILQFIALALFHVRMVAALSLAILAPLLLCTLIFLIIESGPLKLLRHLMEASGVRTKK
ncbi:hypothetical protein [Tengunoibacter tsumagoiensis]|uniref:Uncharacterized protein n=1 Tax=Tengunoibacter tsumagoiensis TaxID=2014871 RepID=A0A402A0A5_9CHLR|nr:hypothetical protein [Tengunoibacter tsumagoiensis]GCE12580.1 hypothetical protein KTT_24390 [Tengunoibacter tsumagoiensis]